MFRYAVVTGGNKGIGLEICRQLASEGVVVVLTARDEKKGARAVEDLKVSGLSNVVLHQLDVNDAASIASLARFLHTEFGKLDILVNLDICKPYINFSSSIISICDRFACRSITQPKVDFLGTGKRSKPILLRVAL